MAKASPLLKALVAAVVTVTVEEDISSTPPTVIVTILTVTIVSKLSPKPSKPPTI